MAPGSDETSDFSESPNDVDFRLSEETSQLVAGKYRLIKPLGEGGMGTVWLAEQLHPVKRTVAVKLIKHGMDSKAVVARFDAERQALALMDHPNIAKILDGGITETGAPFFVMELVRGSPITEFCDSHKLSLAERLKIFVQVCNAIQHAHQKGIIHRDIKPSNILVTLYDDLPVPKVIDFGVAKATRQSLTEKTLNTGIGLVGTPQYMSPEQATLDHLDIDTRSDVYSLGIVLYELMTGSTPFMAEELNQAGYLEILRIIREVDPPKPSTKVSHSEGLQEIAQRRRTDPNKLSVQLRSELDWIAMKALEKDRSQRYGSASTFAEDIQRFLSGESVLAHPPSQIYRLRKLIRKNRGLVTAVAFILFVLLLGMTGTTLGLLEATRQKTVAVEKQHEAELEKENAQKAESEALSAYRASTDDAIKDLLGSQGFLDQSQREYAKKVSKRWEEFAANQTTGTRGLSLKAEGHYQVGKLYRLLGDASDLDELEMALTASQELQKLEPDVDDHKYQNALIRFAIAESYSFKQSRAIDELTIALQTLRELAEKFETDLNYRIRICETTCGLAQGKHLLGDTKASRAEYKVAFEYLDESMELFPEEPKLLYWKSNLHGCFSAMLSESFGYTKESMLHARISSETAEQLCETSSDKVFLNALAEAHGELAHELEHQGGLSSLLESVSNDRKAVAIAEELSTKFPSHGEFKATLAARLNDLGWRLRRTGRVSASIATVEKTLTIKRELAQKYGNHLAFDGGYPIMSFNLINSLIAARRDPDAIEIGKESIARCKALIVQNPDYKYHRHMLFATCDKVIGALQRSGQRAEALQLCTETLEDAVRYSQQFNDEQSYRDCVSVYGIQVKLLRQLDRPAELIETHDRLHEFYNNRVTSAKTVSQALLIDNQRSIASIYLALQNSINGIEHCDKAIEFANKELASAKASVPDAIKDILSQTLELKARLLGLNREHEKALQCLSQAIELNTRQQRSLRIYRAYVRAANGNVPEAVAEARELGNSISSPSEYYDVSCLFALCFASCRADGQLLDKLDDKDRDLDGLAIQALKAAIVSGFRNARHMSQDDDLNSIRKLTEYGPFEKLLTLVADCQQSMKNRQWETALNQAQMAAKKIIEYLESNPDEQWAFMLLSDCNQCIVTALDRLNRIDEKLLSLQQHVTLCRKLGNKSAQSYWQIEAKSRLLEYAQSIVIRDGAPFVLPLLERAAFLFEEPKSENPVETNVYCRALAFRAQANVDSGNTQAGFADWEMAMRKAVSPELEEFQVRQAIAKLQGTESDEIVEEIKSMEDNPRLSAETQFHLACFYATLSARFKHANNKFADRVWLFLDRAISNGFDDSETLQRHPALGDLKSHEEFAVVQLRVARNSER